jgi:hypothetical protein
MMFTASARFMPRCFTNSRPANQTANKAPLPALFFMPYAAAFFKALARRSNCRRQYRRPAGLLQRAGAALKSQIQLLSGQPSKPHFRRRISGAFLFAGQPAPASDRQPVR